ncbi:MAG: sodium-dependent transporter [Planctomycetes bacterium]|nr:sodium-dependent transporter [Planctomycetota bacterium]
MSARGSSRDRWSSRSAFVLAAIGSAVGLGNVIRFPAVCYENGGGAFFIPYLVALFTAGIPLLILEFGVGQMTQLSAPKALKKLNPHTEWVGWFALLVALVICFYYSALMAWAAQYLYYAVMGFFNSGQLAWSAAAIKGGEAAFFETVIRNDFSELGEAATFSDLWTYYWPVVIGLAVVWFATYAIIYKGVHRVGNVVKWTVPLPIVVLGILIAKGISLPNAEDGILYYLTPNLAKLGDPKTWLAAYGQIFFSLTIGFGVMIAYGSYRSKDSDVTNNAFITALSNCAISFIAGFAVFSVVGFLQLQGEEIIQKGKGLGLAFITYPTAITEMGGYWSPIIGVIFFLMLLLLGIDSLFSLVEAAVAALRDRYVHLTQHRLTFLICLVGFVASIIFFANRAGIFWLDTFDHWTNEYGLVLVGLLQCLIVGYFYKTDRLRDYINKVSEIRLWGWWELCIRIITPTVLTFLLSYTLLEDIESGKIYGVYGTAFDSLAKYPVIGFAGLFFIAFAMSKMWSYLLYISLGVAVFFVIWYLLGETSPAIFCALATSILIGGLIHCLSVARKGKVNPEPEA